MGDFDTTEGISSQGPELAQANHPTTAESTSVGQEVVLVIDDDPDMLNCVRRLLRSEGWVVCTASDPLEGLQFYEAHWREIHLVLLDYFLPCLRGDAVFERLQSINPQVRVLLTTASTDDVSPKMLQGGLYGFVQKPVSPRDLVSWIRRTLNHDAQVPQDLLETGQID